MPTCTVIYNPISGKHTIEDHIPIIVDTLHKMGYTCEVKRSEYPKHAIKLSEEVCLQKTDMLLMAGGDGTVNECLNGMFKTDHRPLVSYIPTGTSCDLAKTLGIPKNIKKALKILEDNYAVSMDVVSSSQGYFAYVAALGNYVDVSYSTPEKWKASLGYFAYVLAGVKQFFHIKKIPMRIQLPDGRYDKNYSLALLVNSKRVASFSVINRPILDDGKLDVVLYGHIPFLNNLLFLLSFLLDPKVIPGVRRHVVEEAYVEVDKPYRWTIDGESGMEGSIKVRVIPKALRIIVNRSTRKYFKNQEQ